MSALADRLEAYTRISESGRNDDGIEGVAIPRVDCYDFDAIMMEAAAELRKGEVPMIGRMVEADFSQSTITFEMRGDYVAAAGLYEIRAAAPAPARTDEGGR